MRLSRLADYAIVLMTHMAQHPDATHVAADAAKASRVPLPTTARVMAKLCRAGLLRSERGAKGGYRLARPAESIPIGAIVALFDGPVNLTRCSHSGVQQSCVVETTCPSRAGLQRLTVAVRKALDDVSLQEIAQPQPMLRPAQPTTQAVLRP